MSIFQDKKYEELDFVSQLVEPIESNLNEILASIPDLIEVDFATLTAAYAEGYRGSINIDNIVDRLFGDKFISLSHNEKSTLYSTFILENTDLILNFEEQSLTGSLVLKKIIFTIDDHTLKTLLGDRGFYYLSYINIHDENIGRVNEILELMGCPLDAITTKRARRKRAALLSRWQTIFKTNEWNVKNIELSNKVGKWISLYIEGGDLSALSNFCRFKVMTHSGNAIYSMKEAL